MDTYILVKSSLNLEKKYMLFTSDFFVQVALTLLASQSSAQKTSTSSAAFIASTVTLSY